MPHCVEVPRVLPRGAGGTWFGTEASIKGVLFEQALGGTEVAMRFPKLAAQGDAVAICGVITTREVLRHAPTIVREFGAGAYLRCCVAILRRRRTTFLNCVCEVEPE